MSKIKLTKEEVERITKIKGNVSGAIFVAYKGYLTAKRGKDTILWTEC